MCRSRTHSWVDVGHIHGCGNLVPHPCHQRTRTSAATIFCASQSPLTFAVAIWLKDPFVDRSKVSVSLFVAPKQPELAGGIFVRGMAESDLPSAKRPRFSIEPDVEVQKARRWSI